MYRILTADHKIKFAGTDQESWFVSLGEAVKLASDSGDTVYEYDKDGNRLWEVL